MSGIQFILAIVLLFPLIICSGCNNKDETSARYLQEHPQIVFDILESNPDKMIELMDKTTHARQKKEFLAYIQNSAQQTRLKPSEGSQRLIFGNPQAPITITVYSDFFCGYCRKADAVLEQFMVKHPGRARIAPRYYPLDKKDSLVTAVYVEALGRMSPDKARDLYHHLFKQQDLSGNVESYFAQLLPGIDVDVEKILELAQSEDVQQTVLNDIREADQMGLKGTPLTIVNGVAIAGYVPLEWFEEAVEIIAANPAADI